MEFYAQKCINTTLNNNFCFPANVIDEYLASSQIYLNYFYATNKIDHYNKINPIQDSDYNDQIFLNTNYEIVKMVKYTSDGGSVFEDITTTTGYGRDYQFSYNEVNPLTTKFKLPESVGCIQFNFNSFTIDKYSRTYQKLQSVVANIGGALKLILTLAQTFTRLITHHIYIFNLSSECIETSEVKKDQKQKRNNFVLEKNQVGVENKNYSVSEEMRRRLEPKVKKVMTTWEATVPVCLNKKNRKKILVQKYEELVKQMLSSSTVLKTTVQVEKLKSVLFTQDQFILFNMSRGQTAEELKSAIYDDKKKVTNLTEEVITKQLASKNKLSKGLVKRLMNDLIVENC